MTSISILSIRLSTHISKILDDKAVVESVHLGEVEFWHRRIHNGTCVPLLVKAGEIYFEVEQIHFEVELVHFEVELIHFEVGQIHFAAWTPFALRTNTILTHIWKKVSGMVDCG